MGVIIIKIAKLKDGKQLLNLYQTAIFENRQNPIYTDNIDLTLAGEQASIRHHRRKNCLYLVVWLDNQIVGKLVFTATDANQGKMEIYIRQEFRRQGIGSELMEKFIAWAKEAKIKKITLEVMADNLPAISLYKKFSFQIKNNKSKKYKIGNKTIPSIIMIKSL